jgi:hypothetical protein
LNKLLTCKHAQASLESITKEDKKAKTNKRGTGGWGRKGRQVGGDDIRKSASGGKKSSDDSSLSKSDAKAETAVVISLKEDPVMEEEPVPLVPALPPLFGESLEEAIARSKTTNADYMVPDVIYECCKYLEGNGMLFLFPERSDSFFRSYPVGVV